MILDPFLQDHDGRQCGVEDLIVLGTGGTKVNLTCGMWIHLIEFMNLLFFFGRSKCVNLIIIIATKVKVGCT